MEINLSDIEPPASAPHSPGNIGEIKDLHLPVDQVMIGSCTNSSYVDLMTVAAMLKDKHLPAGVSLGIAPGSRQVLNSIAKNGRLSDLISFWCQNPGVLLRLLHRQQHVALYRLRLGAHQ